MTVHELKIVGKEYADAVHNLSKPFELRYNDRDYKVGDYINFCLWDDENKTVIPHPVSNVLYRITFIVSDPKWGLKDGYVALGIFPENVKYKVY